MPGFVDVSHMSDLEIKRLSQIDEEDPRDSNYSHRNLARRNPYGYNRQTYAKPASEKFSTSDVWAAACAAQRINGEYLKHPQRVFDKDTGLTHDAKRRNRDIMIDFLANPAQLLVEDVVAGENCRKELEKDLSFRTLKGKLTEFDQALSKVMTASNSGHFDSANNKYELAVVASLPNSYQRLQRKQELVDRITESRGGFVATPGDKVTVKVEILGCNYSSNFNIYWITAITDQDQPVFFGFKNPMLVGVTVTVKGTVKAHRDDKTQLSRVKIV